MEQSIVNSNGYSIFIGNDLFETIRSYLHQYEFKENKIFVLTDENSRKYCLPRLMSNIQLLQEVHIMEIDSGEGVKNIDTCKRLWNELTIQGADRDSVLINLGGGVVSDLGGFVASTFKRGIRYINIPTTLLSMVDAGIGGKVGVDLNGLKNQIGVFSNPQVVFLLPDFIDTLPERQVRTGFAEIVKHALIYEGHYWDDLSTKNFDSITNWRDIIEWSVEIKNYYITEDPLDTGFRKVLNFGHTIGHAFETYSNQHDSNSLSHGEAVAIGLICESYISHKYANLPKSELDEIVHYVTENFDHYPIKSGQFDALLNIMLHDKKNKGENINFTLLTSIGNSLINQYADIPLVKESLFFYQSLQT
ncbi:MAG: 3-dehydroquinate synthase [Bacteroidales bacterium]|nr:3-dehydroquinate synthase [Bacteroidales bacterium]MCF8405286.1 3-dehydroquinate synthase [Bacteroidales bacterium]